ncbi:hypothetical protein AA313_de0203063 [Arthrobotrys entomopaga]|nr:hypothetical protein AA313_de0203063 [Arthrobotrys entomopaga]
MIRTSFLGSRAKATSTKQKTWRRSRRREKAGRMDKIPSRLLKIPQRLRKFDGKSRLALCQHRDIHQPCFLPSLGHSLKENSEERTNAWRGEREECLGHITDPTRFSLD